MLLETSWLTAGIKHVRPKIRLKQKYQKKKHILSTNQSKQIIMHLNQTAVIMLVLLAEEFYSL